MAPSASELTCPVRAAGACAATGEVAETARMTAAVKLGNRLVVCIVFLPSNWFSVTYADIVCPEPEVRTRPPVRLRPAAGHQNSESFFDFRSSCEKVPQAIANFEIGTLGCTN